MDIQERAKEWDDYQAYLANLPRAERRRVLKAHMKRIEQSLKAEMKEKVNATS